MARIGANCKEKKGSEKREVLLVSFSDFAHFVFAIIIYRIIANVKKVKITSLPLQSDSVKQAISKNVPSKDLELLKFIAINPKNYMTDTIVYGIFMPQFQAIYSQKKEKVTLKYDFGLRKWGVFNAEDRQVAMFDLASDNMLRYAREMFPDNNAFSKLLFSRE